MALTGKEVKQIGQRAGQAAFDELKEATKTNLAKEYQKLYDLSEEVIHFSSRCSLVATLSRLNFTNRAAQRLREEARLHYEDGLITGKEYLKISDLTEEIVFFNLPRRIKENLVQECNCKISD